MSYNPEEYKKRKIEAALSAAVQWNERIKMRKNPDSVEQKLNEERMKSFKKREKRRLKLVESNLKQLIMPERMIGKNDLRDIAPNQQAMKAGIPVARIQTIPENGFQPEGFASGFMIAPNLLMTNNHVFPTAKSAHKSSANFMYERIASGVHSGYPFEIMPDKFFYTNELLDFTIVYINDNSLDGNMSIRNIGFLRLIDSRGKIIKGEPLHIIQYPLGGHKKYACENNNVVDIWDSKGLLHYSTDTLQGSSGSPAFNKSWEVSALHHSGVPYVVDGKIMAVNGVVWDEDMDEDEIQWVANEGIGISTILAHLKNVQMPDTDMQNLLQAFLETTKDTVMDPAPEIKKNTTTNKLNTKKHMNPIQLNFYGNTTVNVSTGEQSIVAATNDIVNASNLIAVEKKQAFDPDYDHRPGYDPNFLDGTTISLPHVTPDKESELFMNYGDGKPYELKYHHFSLVMNKKRRFMMWSASNIDYNENRKSKKARKDFGTETWSPDPRIPLSFQVTDEEFYKPATNVDRGHIVRREDNCWGDTEEEIGFANADTYHWTNCTPQHERFNQSREGGYQGLWGKLEKHIQGQLDNASQKATLFAGPMLLDDDESEDFGYGSIQYPNKYWKVVVVADDKGELSSYGFILDQTKVVKKFGLVERVELDFSDFKYQQVTIQKITELTKVVFDNQVYESDVLKLSGASNGHDGHEFNDLEEVIVKPKTTKAKIKAKI